MFVNGILEHFPEKNWCPHPEWPGMEAAIQFLYPAIDEKLLSLRGSGYGTDLWTWINGPRVAICAAHEANMITRLLLGEEEI